MIVARYGCKPAIDGGNRHTAIAVSSAAMRTICSAAGESPLAPTETRSLSGFYWILHPVELMLHMVYMLSIYFILGMNPAP
jgi:hypothetical protein